MNPEQLLQHFDRISEAPDAIPKLRRFILDLAVRGKLVEQNPNDEPAAELYKRIQTARKSSLDKGLFKPITKVLDSAQLDIWGVPSTWIVVPLASAVYFQEGPGLRNWQFRESGIPFLNIRTLQDGSVRRELCQCLDPHEVEAKYKHFLLNIGDIVCSTSGTIGKIALIKDSDLPLMLNTSIVRFCPYSEEGPALGFIKLFLQTDTFLDQAKEKVTGAAQVNMGPSHLKEMMFPLPSLAEQHRIVAKVDELMALCDQLQAAQTQREQSRDRLVAASLQSLNLPADDEAANDPETQREHARFLFNHLPRLTTRPAHIKQLRQTILNLAVRGKLVLQDPNDEPAAELLKRIGEERAKLVKAGEIRNEKPLIGITNDDLPFSIPDTWKWAKIGSSALFTEYGTSQQSFQMDDGIPVLKMGDIQDGKVLLGGQKKVSNAIDDLPALYLKKFDLLYNRTNSAELVGKTGIYLGDDNQYTFASYLIRIRLSKFAMNAMYFNLAMNSPYFRKTQIVPHLKQQCGQANVNGTILKNMLVPIPPLVEQHRIVAKVDELMALCDQLETQLTSTASDSRRLLQAVLHEALLPATKQAA